MIVTFWGVRGSTPAPGSDTVRYGGNTACVSVELEDRLLVLDAGTGIRELGRSLTKSETKDTGGERPITIILTHLHTDHISGFPFFQPLYEPGRTIELVGYPREGEYWSLLDLLDGVHFPLTATEVAATCRVVEDSPQAVLASSEVGLQRIAVTHPGGAHGYRLTEDGRSFVFIPDHEIGAAPPASPWSDVVDFCRGADVLCHDAQYLAEEFPERKGWGHSRVRDACDLAVESGVDHLILFHHDPQRSDADLDRIEQRARAQLSAHGIGCTVAYEGLSVSL